MREALAMKQQRERMQGLGKGIISVKHGDYRLVAVGNRVYYSKTWGTFHDFLRAFLMGQLGDAWLKEENVKPEPFQHPIIRWVNQANADIKRLGTTVGRLRTGPMTGAQQALLNLAYNIYLMAHHLHPSQMDKLYGRFIARLKINQEFIGALFETYAAAAFLKAGFNIAYEDEGDGSGSHVEFVATYPRTGKSFSVEVKTRNRSATEDGSVDDRKRLRVGSKLMKALLKYAAHPRIVMIEINVPDRLEPDAEDGWPVAAIEQIKETEANRRSDDTPFDPAYVIVTNHAFHNNLEMVGAGTQMLGAGFRIHDFGHGVQYQGFWAYLKAKERHAEMVALLDSMREHYEIPATFDNEIPELAFQEEGALPRLKIGTRYLVPTEDGGEAPGVLEEATVLETEKKAYCVYKMDDGKRAIVTAPMSDAEIAGWKKHPETFFGQIRPHSRTIKTELELMEFLWGSYQKTPREKLLGWLANAADFERLKAMPDDELAATYCERIGVSGWRESNRSATADK